MLPLAWLTMIHFSTRRVEYLSHKIYIFSFFWREKLRQHHLCFTNFFQACKLGDDHMRYSKILSKIQRECLVTWVTLVGFDRWLVLKVGLAGQYNLSRFHTWTFSTVCFSHINNTAEDSQVRLQVFFCTEHIDTSVTKRSGNIYVYGTAFSYWDINFIFIVFFISIMN